MGNDEKPYTTGEVAEMSHVTINAVKKWISAGKLAAFRTPGGHFRIKKEDFRVFVNKYKFHIKDEILPEKKKILVIDDDPQIVEYLTAVFASDKSGYEVQTASDGYEALIKIGNFMPDIIILDIRMPRVDGYEVIKRLRSNDATKGIKILAATAYGNEDGTRIVESGADKCLNKPLNTDEVRSSVKALLKKQ